MLVWRLVNSTCHIVLPILPSSSWNWVGLCFQSRDTNPTAANRNSTGVQTVIETPKAGDFKHHAVHCNFIVTHSLKSFRFLFFPPEDDWVSPTPFFVDMVDVIYPLCPKAWLYGWLSQCCHPISLLLGYVPWEKRLKVWYTGTEIWGSSSRLTMDKQHSKKPDQGSRVKPKQFSGVRMDNAKSRSQAQESTSMRWWGREWALGDSE